MLSERELEFLSRVATGVRLRLADREEDRIRQRMRQAGFAEVVMSPRRWIITPAGRDALRPTPSEDQKRDAP